MRCNSIQLYDFSTYIANTVECSNCNTFFYLIFFYSRNDFYCFRFASANATNFQAMKFFKKFMLLLKYVSDQFLSMLFQVF